MEPQAIPAELHDKARAILRKKLDASMEPQAIPAELRICRTKRSTAIVALQWSRRRSLRSYYFECCECPC